MNTARLALLPLLALIATFTLGPALAQDDPCDQPQPVCAARGAVFAISGFDPVASAVRVAANRLVTNRHTVADLKSVTVHLPGGGEVAARTVPSDWAGDLIFLESDELPDGLILQPAEPTAEPTAEPAAGSVGELALYTVGADLGRGTIRAYDPGPLHALPAEGHPLARLHHGAYSQPGNSGGALVDAQGRLIGITASGGEGRYEAIPATALATLAEHSGPERAEASDELGEAVRICTLLLDQMQQAGPGKLAGDEAEVLSASCMDSGNRQLFDLAGQTFGRMAETEAALGFFRKALEQDPKAVNSRIGLVVTYSLARRYEEALPHLEALMESAGEDMQVLRLAIQAGVWGGDRDFAERAYARLETLNPKMAPAARRFLDNPPPRP